VSDQEGVIRVNISVPKALKAHMENAGERTNWSAVAVEAFKAKLLQIESEAKGAEQMEDVIKRLKAAQEADANNDHLAGRAAGERWVKTRARPKQLRSLQMAVEDAGGSEELLYQGGGEPYPPATLWSAINVDKELDVGEMNAFWEVVLDPVPGRIENPDFAAGFIDGALDLWEKVEDQV